MKFSQDTINILKNYVGINPGMLFEKGHKQYTCSIAKTIRSVVEIEEDIPEKFAVSNLAQFLNAVQFFGPDTDVDIQEKFAIIRSEDGEQSMKYVFSDERLVEQPNKDLSANLDYCLEFVVTNSQLKQIFKASGILGLNDFVVYNENKGDKIYISATNKSNASSSDFKICLGTDDNAVGKEIKVFFKKGNFKFIEGVDYTVKISDKGISVWQAGTPYETLKYYCVIEATGSTFK